MRFPTKERNRPRWLLELLHEAVEDQRSDWIVECADVQAAHESWSHAPASERAGAYTAFCTALQREEQACATYRELLEELATADARQRRQQPV